MAVKIRLARHGAKKRPYYRVVVADSRAPRDGRIIEEVGRYNPMTAPKTINLDLEKIADWQSKGAQLTDAVAALVKAANEGEKTETVVKKSKKQLAKEAEAAKAAAEAAYKVAVKAVDQAVVKGLLHKNNAARKKSSMTLKLNKLA